MNYDELVLKLVLHGSILKFKLGLKLFLDFDVKGHRVQGEQFLDQ